MTNLDHKSQKFKLENDSVKRKRLVLVRTPLCVF